MSITVHYFAHLKDKRGKEMEEFAFEKPISVAQLFEKIFHEENSPSYIRAAVNEEYVDWNSMLADGDEIVFIPPVAGG